LYYFVIAGMTHPHILRGKDVADISCGRGGGTVFLTHHFKV